MYQKLMLQTQRKNGETDASKLNMVIKGCISKSSYQYRINRYSAQEKQGFHME
jgi:translation initiation factor 2 beta subunit (eIF-2beta)/eIF-5